MKFAIAHADLMNNDITIEIIVADSLKHAILAHTAFNSPESKPEYDKWFEEMPDKLEDIKAFFFDGDTLIGATEIPQGGADGL